MKTSSFFSHMLLRFRYPVSLPEEVAVALGVDVSNCHSFNELVNRLSCPSCKPTRLSRFMPRDQAEKAFKSAYRKEKFHQNSLYSYYFNEGWIEFVLKFDDQSRLRRIYLQHKHVSEDSGIELALN